jgi:hypothetical protein
VKGQCHAPAVLCPRERPGTHCTRGWVGSRTGLDRCGKSRPTEIRSPDRPARSQLLYRLRYPAHNIRTICAEKWHRAGFFPSNAVPYRQASFHQSPGAGTIGNSADSLRLITVTTLIELLLTDVLSQPICGPQKKYHNTQTQIAKDNKLYTHETNTNRTKDYLIN